MLNNIIGDKLERFKSEFKHQSTINSPYIVKAFSKGKIVDEDGVSHPFYVMDRYDCSLRDLMKQNNNRNNKFIKYILQLSKALKLMHKKGIIHRDIKPENILYDKKRDKVLICDFGVAKDVNANMSIS